jgi:hypothetical protein
MITGVAIRYRGRVYSLHKPSRHHHVIQEIARITGEESIGENEQGFLDSADNFLTRQQALVVALAAGQVLKPLEIRGSRLYSEDLW